MTASTTDLTVRDLIDEVAPGANATPAICVALIAEERMQRLFMALYQTLMLILTAATVVVLLVFLWRVVEGIDVSAGLSAAGAVVTGSAAVFARSQRNDARSAHQVAKSGLEEQDCLSP